MERVYQICTRCIMDTTDSDIEFDENGVCNHCKKHDELVRESTTITWSTYSLARRTMLPMWRSSL